MPSESKNNKLSSLLLIMLREKLVEVETLNRSKENPKGGANGLLCRGHIEEIFVEGPVTETLRYGGELLLYLDHDELAGGEEIIVL